ncbi:unnamed protein product [Pocillopora meandrina]|uniref:Uncharacterized protein n=1 Tax=Pocillopora meandrina TaxID=46732 RepID=A0AAU9XQJ4_9CNID|nr:unnamed protein product [Pocillopora meandrina]
MVFLGVLVDTTDMTVSVTPDRLSELQSRCTSLLSVTHVSRHDLQSLLGVMSFVTSCVRLARVFMSSLLYTLRTYRLSKNCPLSTGVNNTIADHLSRWHLSPVHHLRFDALTADTPTTHILCPP